MYLAGRTHAKLDRVAREIWAAGGFAESAVVDALDEAAVERHADAVAQSAGAIDVTLNAVGIPHVQGPPLGELTFEDFAHPIQACTRTNFLTARAAARHMVRQGSGLILTLSTPGARMSGPGFLCNGVASAAIEAFSRILAGELGPSGVRVVCPRPDAIPEAVPVSQNHHRAVQSHGREAPATSSRTPPASSGPGPRRPWPG